MHAHLTRTLHITLNLHLHRHRTIFWRGDRVTYTVSMLFELLHANSTPTHTRRVRILCRCYSNPAMDTAHQTDSFLPSPFIHSSVHSFVSAHLPCGGVASRPSLVRSLVAVGWPGPFFHRRSTPRPRPDLLCVRASRVVSVCARVYCVVAPSFLPIPPWTLKQSLGCPSLPSLALSRAACRKEYR